MESIWSGVGQMALSWWPSLLPQGHHAERIQLLAPSLFSVLQSDSVDDINNLQIRKNKRFVF